MQRLLLSFALLATTALPAAAAAPEAPGLIAVKFHADWCGSCKQMGTAFEDLRNKFDGKPVLFVVLDRTTVTPTPQSALHASALGIAEVYEANPGTGFILLLDGKTREVSEKLGASLTLKEMSASLQEALSKRAS